MTTNSTNPVLGADCRSFEYAQPPGALKKGCAVLNFNHTFYAIRPNGSSGFTESNISEVFFTMPTLMTNGRAANLTAIAVTGAIKATDIWYGLNPFATKFAVGDFFRRAIQIQCVLLEVLLVQHPLFQYQAQLHILFLL